MARTSPAQFVQQVRSEVGKVSWPGRREVMLTTLMILLLAAFAATFFSLTDMAIRFGLTQILTYFGS